MIKNPDTSQSVGENSSAWRKNIFKKVDLYTLGVSCLVILVIIIRIPYLSLPYYWDEAWPYGPAVRMMLENGVSLMPGAIPAEISRGHPLLFHALAAGWMKIFGTSLTMSHIFPLIISLALLIFVYFFCKKLFSREVGLLACIFLVIQQVFLAQASMLLPEMLVALFVITSLYAFVQQRFVAYVILATCLCLTKESGVVIFPALLILLLIDHFKTKELTNKQFFSRIIIVIMPIVTSSVFFILQNKINGWYFSPVNTNDISFTPEVMFYKFEITFFHLFLFQHRNLLTLTTLICCIVCYRMHPGYYAKNRIILLLAIFTTIYLLFSTVCFFSPRYLLSCYPRFAIIAAYFIYEVFKKYRLVFMAIPAIVITQASFIFTVQNKDHNLGYINAVKVNQDVVKYFEENHLHEKKIFTHFLMRMSLTDPYAGYLSGAPFSTVTRVYNDSTEYCIFSECEYETQFDRIKAENKLQLIKRFERNNAWSEIYHVIR